MQLLQFLLLFRFIFLFDQDSFAYSFAFSLGKCLNVLSRLLFADSLDILINHLLPIQPHFSCPILLLLFQLFKGYLYHPKSNTSLRQSVQPLSEWLSYLRHSALEADVVEDVTGHPLEPGIVGGELVFQLVRLPQEHVDHSQFFWYILGITIVT